MELMDLQPYQFLIQTEERDWVPFTSFVHRTFQGDDCLFFLHRLKEIYSTGGLEDMFSGCFQQTGNMAAAISSFKQLFFEGEHLSRTEKHLPDPLKGSAAKRFNMFLRWMVRKDSQGVDFGIWTGIKPADLYCPLDVHSGNVARKLGLLIRKQNDWKAVEELTGNLRQMDQVDPVKYDIVLFSLGVNDFRLNPTISVLFRHDGR